MVRGKVYRSIHWQATADIDRLLSDDFIEPDYATAADLEDATALRSKVEKLHKRDQGRYFSALRVEETLSPSDVNTIMYLTCADIGLGGVGENGSLRQLCNYLADALLFCAAAQRPHPTKPGKNIPPLVLHESSFHVAQQDQWIPCEPDCS